nr:serine/arginine repetitive matrix protein 1-like isoform X1 [Ipomoea batatas]
MGLSDNGKLGHDDEYPYEDHDDGHFEVHSSNWGSRASWMSHDDSPPRHNGRPFEANRPDGSNRSTYTTYHDSPPRYHQRNELMSRPSLDTKPNWPSRSESPPPEIMMQSKLVSYPNSGTRPKYYESSHPKSNPRPNCTKARDDSPPKSTVLQPMAHLISDDLMKAIDEEATTKRENPIASQRPHSTRPYRSESTLIDNMEPVKKYGVLDCQYAAKKYGGILIPFDNGSGECVVNQHAAIDSLEARRRYLFTQVERSPNTIPSSSLLRFVVNRRNKRRQTIEANPKASEKLALMNSTKIAICTYESEVQTSEVGILLFVDVNLKLEYYG